MHKIVAQLVCLDTNATADERDQVLVPVIYMLRMLGNLLAIHKDSGVALVAGLRGYGRVTVSSVFGRVCRIDDDQLGGEVHWLVRNLSACKDERVVSYLENDICLRRLVLVELQDPQSVPISV